MTAQDGSGGRGVGDVDDGPSDGQALTRRGLVGVASGAAGGLVLAGTPTLAQGAGKPVGSGKTDQKTVGFVGRIDQEGQQLTGYGYVTRIRGISPAQLFTVPRGVSSFDPSTSDPSTARFTHLCSAQVQSVSALDDVITVVATGVINFFYLPNGGATFDNPESFGAGKQIASFRAEFQDDLALEQPQRANIQLSANLDQRKAARFQIGGKSRQFGAKGLKWTLEANGRGQLLDPGPPRSVLLIGGALSVSDADRP